MEKKKSNVQLMTALIVILAVLVLFSIAAGRFSISFSDFFGVIREKIYGGDTYEAAATVLFTSRIPRILACGADWMRVVGIRSGLSGQFQKSNGLSGPFGRFSGSGIWSGSWIPAGASCCRRAVFVFQLRFNFCSDHLYDQQADHRRAGGS